MKNAMDVSGEKRINQLEMLTKLGSRPMEIELIKSIADEVQANKANKSMNN